jgi:nitroreductase
MDLIETLRTTGAVRTFTDEPVDDAAVHRILDTARFAPSGGNRQGWRVVVVQDPARRRALRDAYLDGWDEYLALTGAGLVPFAPLNDRTAEVAALAGPGAVGRGDFADHLDDAPALLLVLADLRVLAAVDRDLDRYTFAGGASVYPFVWSLLLAARAEGLAGVITTVAVRREARVKEIFAVPDELAVAALVVLGHPVRQPRSLRRAPVGEFATRDQVGGPPFGA